MFPSPVGRREMVRTRWIGNLMRLKETRVMRARIGKSKKNAYLRVIYLVSQELGKQRQMVVV